VKQDATFQPCCTLQIQGRAALEEFREATVLSPPSAVRLFPAQHSGNRNPRPTNPILAVAVYPHGRRELPMSDGCAASRSSHFAADRARTRAAKGKPLSGTIMTRRESAGGHVLLREKA
jgi:hypothetical protein